MSRIYLLEERENPPRRKAKTRRKKKAGSKTASRRKKSTKKKASTRRSSSSGTKKKTRTKKKTTKRKTMARRKKKRTTRKKKRTAARRPKRRATKKTTRRKAKRRSAARRPKRKTKRRTSSRRRNPKRRTSRRRSSRRRNPVSRRYVGGSPKKKYRRNPKRRSNPAKRAGKGLMRKLRSVASLRTAANVGQGVLGVSAALVGPRLVARWAGRPNLNRGWAGVALSALSAIAAAQVASAIGWKKASKSLLAGGLLGAGLRLVALALPDRYARQWLPIEDLTGRPTMLTAAPAPRVSALPGPGATSFQTLQQGAAGMGAMMTADDLIAGERAAGHLGRGDYDDGIGDYMQLGQPVPRSQIAGMGHMGDYLNFAQAGAVPQAQAMTNFQSSLAATATERF